MTPAFWLCLLLVIASGLSAYIGNEWGRKLGKRKLSIFRMRPKHSSTFVTILLSMCLSLGLMGILFSTMPSLQKSFFTSPSSSSEQEAFTRYEDALQLANSQLQRLSQKERSENKTATSAPQLAIALAPTASPVAEKTIAIPSLRSERSTRAPKTPAQAPQAKPKSHHHKRPSTPTALAALPKRVTESRLKARAIKPLTPNILPSSRPINTVKEVDTPKESLPQSNAIAALPNYPTGALFELTVNGELNTTESTQLRQGIQRLTQNYLGLLGIQEEALSFKSAQIQQEIVKLSSSGQYRLQIALAPSQTTDISVDISVSKLNTSATNLDDNEAFDPQLLLEEQRLQSSSTQQSLQQDLQAVLRKHAKQQQIALKITPKILSQTRSAQLPFEILNVVNQNGVIRGELFLR